MMEKGKSGIMLGAIAATAFVMCFLGWSTAIILILGFVLIVERNEWLTKQVLKALYLSIGYSLIISVVNIAFNILYRTIGNINFIYDLLRIVDTLAVNVVNIGVLIICLLAALKAVKGEETTVPLMDNLAGQTLGIINNVSKE